MYRYLCNKWQFKSFYMLLFLNCMMSTIIPIAYAENVCGSVEVGPINVASLRKLKECHVIAGHVKIAKVDITNLTDIVSSVREITDYLLIYRVSGLKSLGEIFPNLTVIRGRSLLFDEYSLAIYDNQNLKYLEMSSLMRVQHGSIRIEKNPLLCYLNTVNWPHLLEQPIKQHLYFKDNKHPYHCPLCSKKVPPNHADLYFTGSCWSYNVFQRHCPDKCGSKGCNLSGHCCSENCLFGCTKSDIGDCQICEEFLLKNSTGHISCVDQCKFHYYQFQERECVLRDECNRRGFTILGDLCVDKCPSNYYRRTQNGIDECIQLCRGNFVLNTADDVSQLNGCSKIEGSITIELFKEKEGNIILDLENSLGAIEEITGYLKIIKSSQIMSLHFFDSLNTIAGEELIDQKYAFYVMNNNHLENIWAREVAILKGRIFFHLNPMLCYEKILKLSSNMKSSSNITINEASPNSNGERTICGEVVKTLNATVEDFNSNEVRIKVNPMKMDEKRALLGYLYYYKITPRGIPTMYDGRHGCGLDRWQFDMTHNQNVRHVISNLVPFTRYAYFVKTFTMTDYHIRTDAYSPIQFFTTLPSKPERVEKIFYYTPYIKQIDLHWWPPKNPNGVITKYLINVTKVQAKTEVNDSILSQRNIESYFNITETKISDNCSCSIEKKMRGGPPIDANFYDEEEIIFDDRLPELLFSVRKPTVESPKGNENITASSTKDKISKIDENNTIINSVLKPEKINDNKTITNSTMVSNNTEKPILSHANINTTSDPQMNNENKTEISITSEISKTSGKSTLTKKQAEIIQSYAESLEKNSTLEQETGAELFNITKPNKLCAIPNPDTAYILVNKCVIPKNYSGIEVRGNVHKYEIKDLEKSQIYRISIRACTEGIEDPCSEEMTIEAGTDSEDLEQFFREQ